MTAIQNAAPQYVLDGIKDNSGRRADPEREALPIHLPLVFFYAERGPSAAQILTGGDARRLYGAKTFDYRGAYANHATALLQEALYPGSGAVMHQRVIPANARKARLAVYLDLLETAIPVYERNSDGSFRLDTNGDRISTGSTVPGYKGKWVVEAIPPTGIGARAIGAAVQLPGTQNDGAHGQSVKYPIFDAEVSFEGKYGDNVGFRLYAPTTRSALPVNPSLVTDLNAYVFRLQFLERPTAQSTPNIIRTREDEVAVDFCLKPDSFHDKTKREYGMAEAVLPAYSDKTIGVAPTFSPFGIFHAYQNNIDTVLSLIYEGEESYMGLGAGIDGTYLIDPFTGTTVDGVPYHTYEVVGVLDGGAAFNDSAVYYAKDGTDGTMSDAAFDLLVRNELEKYGELENRYLDELRFPHSFVYDSGFSVETKEAFLSLLSRRKDIIPIVSTQDVSQPQNSQTVESSMGVALATAARFHPESVLHGTGVCRAAIIGQSGYLINSTYKKLVPMTFEVAYKLARWAGASNGILNERWAPDVSPNNKLELLTRVNCTYKTAAVRNKDWVNGVVWAQSYDTMSDFIPAVQTVYGDDTSVLNSLLVVIIASELQKVCMRVWRDMVGRTDLTKDQFKKKSDQLITQYGSETRFGNRVRIVPDTHFTVRDEQLGYKVSANINLYANNMISVGSFTIVADRMEALNNG